jgi:putative membrane protein
MMSAFVLSSVFLLSYVFSKLVLDHATTKYDGEYVFTYLFILISHILLSIPVLPLALFSMYRGLTGEFEKHKSIVKWTFPIWMYVAVTGVLVYIFMSDYY